MPTHSDGNFAMLLNTHNKSFKFVPALRASTGHKTAAQFYAG
jgi:hypothetical protein